jgi:hypothetical protein
VSDDTIDARRIHAAAPATRTMHHEPQRQKKESEKQSGH